MTFNLSTLDTAVIVLYFLCIISWGLFHVSRKSAEDYFLGGRGMTWPFIGLSMFAMVVSSSAIIGWAGDAYSTGISVFNYGMSGGIIVMVFFLVFFLPFYLKNKIYTLPEFLEGRFDKRSRYYFSVITIIGYTFLDAAVTLYAGARMIKIVFPGTELWILILILAFIAGSYTIIGGLTSVMYADLLQAGILFISAAIVTFFVFSEAGGWTSVMHKTPGNLTSMIRPGNDPSVPWLALIISLPLLGFYYWGTNQAMVQRTLSAKSINHGRWGNLFAAFLTFGIFAFMVLPGIAGRIVFPNLQNGDDIYPVMVFNLLPKGLIGLVVAGLLAAMSSTLSAILNSASTLVTIDFAKKIKPNISNKGQVRVGNIAGVIILAIAVIWAPQIEKFGSIIKYFQQLLAYISPPVVAVFIWGVFWKKATNDGAFYGLLSGLTISIVLVLFPHTAMLEKMHFLYVAPIVFFISSLTIFVVSQFTKQTTHDVIEKYTWSKKVFSLETIELKNIPWYKNYRILSIILLIISLIFLYVWK